MGRAVKKTRIPVKKSTAAGGSHLTLALPGSAKSDVQRAVFIKEVRSRGAEVGGTAAISTPELGSNGQATLKKFEEYASMCHTPRQFQRLLRELRSIVPYRCIAYGWGNPTTYAIARVGDVNYPQSFLGWYFSSGVIRRDPVFHEWLRTRKCQRWGDVLKRMPEKFDPEYIKETERHGLQHTMAGGIVEVEGEVGSYFSLAMNSEEDCRNSFETVSTLLATIGKAFKRSYPVPALYEGKKKEILKLLSWGFEQKEIAYKLGISERTVKRHVEEIKKKLYAKSTENAVAIAIRWGIIQ